MNKQQLIAQIRQKKSFLCIGLDPDLDKLPAHFPKTVESIFEFNKAIIDATHKYCVSYKPNTAFYECYGVAGWKALEETIRYIKTNHPEIFVIADAKRGDIGNTSTMYAKAFFNNMNADAVTVAPYMGQDSVAPFLQFENKWAIVLGLTSNEGSRDFQMIPIPKFTTDGRVEVQLVSEHVIKKCSSWGTTENLMFVIGATKAQLLIEIRKLIPDHFLLVPGVGAQGGSLAEVAKHGLNKDCGLLVNSSRGIIYASNGKDFAEKAAEEAKKLQKEMATFL